MASSDEEDLDALRNAALASLRQKQAAQEPQGIQVLSRSAIQTVNQYNQQISEPILHPDGNYDYTEYGEVPFAFQQAVLCRQARGRGRGFHRGRGRGRGNRFPPKPEPQSALIVIQPSGGQEEQAKMVETSRDSRPFLLRPQDKWAATESGSQSSTPTRPKDTSKFSRYDDATDSEDDDDVVEKSRRKSVGVTMDMSLEDVSSDTEVEVHKNHNNEVEVHKHENEVEVHNSEQDVNDSVEVNEKNSGLTDAESAIDTSQNITIDEIHSDLNTSQNIEKSDKDVSADTARNEDFKAEDTETKASKFSESTNTALNEENSLVNENIETNLIIGEVSDSTPLRDELTPVQDELKQEDSVSNSYSAFSRFNRRNRRDSDSAEDSAEESDIELKSVSNSRNSSVSRDSSRYQSESENNIADSDNNVNNIEAVPDTENKESPKMHLTHTKIDQPSKESKLSVTSSLKSSTSSTKSSSASASSSESDSNSSSASSSSSSSDSESSPETSWNQKSKSVSKAKTQVKTVKRISESQVDRGLKSRPLPERKRSETNDLSEGNLKRSTKRSDDKYRDSEKRSEDYSKRERERDTKSPIRKSGRERSFQKKSVKERLTVEEVKADPEFDATNYRDETMYQRNDRKGRLGKSRVDFDRKQNRENRIGNSKANMKYKDEYEISDKSVKSKSKSERGKPGEKRYFEEIARLKIEEAKDSRDSVCKRDTETSSNYRQRKRSRSNSVDNKNDRRKTLHAMEQNKKERNAKSSKSDSLLISSKAAKSQNDLKDSVKHRGKERRKSEEKLKRKSTEDKEKSKQKNTKLEQKTKRKSIDEKLQKLASRTVKSDLESESEKSVSSLSDLSSDSETETWRDKKHGASRKTADIELEKRRRELKVREMRKEMNRKTEKRSLERGDGDRDWNKKSKHKGSDSKVEKYSSEVGERQTYRKGDHRDRRKEDLEENSRQKYYHKKNMVFYEEDDRKKFEELSSESDSDVRKGVISVVKTGQKKVTEEIPCLLDISVSKPKISKKDRKVRNKSPKKERLIIHIEKSSDEEISSTKSRKKKVKKRKKWSSDEDVDETPVEQVVNITFDKEVEPKKSTKSVYERLGMAVNKNSSSKSAISDDSEFQKSHEVTLPSGGKRIKLSTGGKHGGTDKQQTDEDKGEDDDVALNLRIQKIQEKNAEILRRKKEVEQDKQKYG